MIENIILGVGAGIAYGLSTFAKKEDQEFEWNKFLTTATIGAAAGVVQGVTNMPLSGAYEVVINMGGIVAVENLLKILKRKVWDRYVTNKRPYYP